MSAPPEIPGYTLGAALGSGGAATVWAATDHGGRPVAIKVVGDHLPRAQLAKRAEQEAWLCWSINHPHVVRVHDWGALAEGGFFLVMERLRGETLAARLDREAPLEVGVALTLIRQIATALQVVHQRGALHRDVKPENVFLCEDGPAPDHAKLLDLGLVRLSEDDPRRLVRTEAGTMAGTPGFMPPEQVLAHEMDARSDLWALGATLFCALTGQPPYEGRTPTRRLEAVVTAEGPPPVPGHVPQPVADLLDRLLQPAIERRMSSAVEVIAALDALGKGASDLAAEQATGELTLRTGDLVAPSLGDIGDEDRFRAHVLDTVSTLYRPGHTPPGIRSLLALIGQLQLRRLELAEACESARRRADELAVEIEGRARRLRAAHEAVRRELDEAQGGHLRKSAELIELASQLSDLDRSYHSRYREFVEMRRIAGQRAYERQEPIDLGGLFGRSVQAQAEALDRLHEQRAELLAWQSTVRVELRETYTGAADLRAQALELERSLLSVEAERSDALALLEDAARVLEDDVIRAEQGIEHAYLRLALELQRASLG